MANPFSGLFSLVSRRGVVSANDRSSEAIFSAEKSSNLVENTVTSVFTGMRKQTAAVHTIVITGGYFTRGTKPVSNYVEVDTMKCRNGPMQLSRELFRAEREPVVLDRGRSPNRSAAPFRARNIGSVLAGQFIILKPVLDTVTLEKEN